MGRSPDRMYQCLERPDLCRGLGLYTMHLKSKHSFPELRTDENDSRRGGWGWSAAIPWTPCGRGL
jgi:hypothetical protein